MQRRCGSFMNKKHKWVYDGLSPHNGEYWYKCTKCGATDWIASYGTIDQLTPKTCITKSKDVSKIKDTLAESE